MSLVQSEVPTIYVQAGVTDASVGQVRWAPVKSLWCSTMYLSAIIGGWLTVSWENFIVFLVTSAITLCLGHSLGMHRRLIHQSYDCPKWLEYLFVHFGVLVGLAGPFGMSQTHDTRDWAQRQLKSHPYFGHKGGFLKDWWWQLHCDLKLNYPPAFRPLPILKDDPIYTFMEKTWMLQQIPLAALLLFLGGFEWLIWGISVRVAISITGHWLIGYFAHNKGHRSWHIKDASVQGHNIKLCSLITFGECWHNNHHAFPGSAKLALNKHETDPGWWVLLVLKKCGLVWDLKQPEDLATRAELMRL